MLLLQLLHLLRLALLVVGVLLLDLLHLRRELLHLAHGADLLHEGLEHDRPEREDQEDDGERPRGAVVSPKTLPNTQCQHQRMNDTG